jgi:hypothetical protein
MRLMAYLILTTDFLHHTVETDANELSKQSNDSISCTFYISLLALFYDVIIMILKAFVNAT